VGNIYNPARGRLDADTRPYDDGNEEDGKKKIEEPIRMAPGRARGFSKSVLLLQLRKKGQR